MRFHTSLSLESFERKISESLERKISESLERKMPPIESLEREILNLKLENFGREKKERKRMGENISFERKKNVHNINLLCYMNCQSLNFCLSLQTLMIWPKRKARVFFWQQVFQLRLIRGHLRLSNFRFRRKHHLHQAAVLHRLKLNFDVMVKDVWQGAKFVK